MPLKKRNLVCLMSSLRLLTSLRGKEKKPCEQFLQPFEISRAFLPPAMHGENCGKYQNVVEIAHKAVVLILLLFCPNT